MTVDPFTPRHSTSEAAALAGVSGLQIHRWCRAGAFATAAQAPGHGNHRRFSDADIAVLQVLGRVAAFLPLGLPPVLVVRIAGVVRYRTPVHRWLLIVPSAAEYRVYLARTLYVSDVALAVAL